MLELFQIVKVILSQHLPEAEGPRDEKEEFGLYFSVLGLTVLQGLLIFKQVLLLPRIG